MKIAVTMPAWNQIQYTQWTVESMIRNSKPHNVEYVFVDNGSTDEFKTYDYLASKRPSVLIRNEKNMGVSYAWNQGLKAALDLNPDIICLQSNDVLAGPNWLDSVVRELSKPEKRYFLPNGEFTDHQKFEDEVRGRLPGLSGTKPGKSGWCLFFTPEAVRTFYPVPNELFLWYGDDYIHFVLEKAGYTRLVLNDSCAFHFVSKTIFHTPNYTDIIAKDKAAYIRITGHQIP